jgi:hypothetical protein
MLDVVFWAVIIVGILMGLPKKDDKIRRLGE